MHLVYAPLYHAGHTVGVHKLCMERKKRDILVKPTILFPKYSG